MGYVQFGECGCMVIDLDGINCIRIQSDDREGHCVLEKMADHRGTIAEIGYPETAEMVASLHNLIVDGFKYRIIKKELLSK